MNLSSRRLPSKMNPIVSIERIRMLAYKRFATTTAAAVRGGEGSVVKFNEEYKTQPRRNAALLAVLKTIEKTEKRLYSYATNHGLQAKEVSMKEFATILRKETVQPLKAMLNHRRKQEEEEEGENKEDDTLHRKTDGEDDREATSSTNKMTPSKSWSNLKDIQDDTFPEPLISPTAGRTFDDERSDIAVAGSQEGPRTERPTESVVLTSKRDDVDAFQDADDDDDDDDFGRDFETDDVDLDAIPVIAARTRNEAPETSAVENGENDADDWGDDFGNGAINEDDDGDKIDWGDDDDNDNGGGSTGGDEIDWGDEGEREENVADPSDVDVSTEMTSNLSSVPTSVRLSDLKEMAAIRLSEDAKRLRVLEMRVKELEHENEALRRRRQEDGL